jgi:hypothetical protein
MRSLFGTTFGSSTLRSLFIGGLTLCSGVAFAEEPIASSDAAPPSVVTQSTTTTVTTAAPVAPPAPVAPAAPVAPSLPPPPMMPAPPVAAAPMAPPAPATTGSFQGPVYYNGPVWIIPAPSSGQPIAPQYAPPVYAPPPVYTPPPQVYAPPQQYYVPPPRYAPPVRRYTASRYLAPRPARGPVVGMGVRFTTMGISSQQVFGQDVNLYGGGLFMRFRSQGRFGFELAMDVMRANIGDGAYVRTSYPFTAAPMLYLFQNRPENHFNIYGIAGFGLMADDVALYKGSPMELNQQFWEVMGHAGGGIELRFKKLAIFGDVRAIGMLMDDSSPAGMFYRDVEGGPIPANSAGYKINLGALLWF